MNKTNVRPIGNATIEVLQKRRAEKPEQRKASREAALRYISFPTKLLFGCLLSHSAVTVTTAVAKNIASRTSHPDSDVPLQLECFYTIPHLHIKNIFTLSIVLRRSHCMLLKSGLA